MATTTDFKQDLRYGKTLIAKCDAADKWISWTYFPEEDEVMILEGSGQIGQGWDDRRFETWFGGTAGLKAFATSQSWTTNF